MSGAASTWNPNADGSVFALAATGGAVYIGGGFASVGGQPQSGLAAVTADQTVSVGGDPAAVGGALALAPNPARGVVQIQYAVAREGRVRLELIDVAGRVEATLADWIHTPGS